MVYFMQVLLNLDTSMNYLHDKSLIIVFWMTLKFISRSFKFKRLKLRHSVDFTFGYCFIIAPIWSLKCRYYLVYVIFINKI